MLLVWLDAFPKELLWVLSRKKKKKSSAPSALAVWVVQEKPAEDRIAITVGVIAMEVTQPTSTSQLCDTVYGTGRISSHTYSMTFIEQKLFLDCSNFTAVIPLSLLLLPLLWAKHWSRKAACQLSLETGFHKLPDRNGIIGGMLSVSIFYTDVTDSRLG